MTESGDRTVRPERLDNWLAGRGRISSEEKERLKLLADNQRNIQNLERRGEGKDQRKVRKSIRTWIEQGKSKDVEFSSQSKDVRDRQIDAIIALRYLDVEPDEGTFYVKGRAA